MIVVVCQMILSIKRRMASDYRVKSQASRWVVASDYRIRSTVAHVYGGERPSRQVSRTAQGGRQQSLKVSVNDSHEFIKGFKASLRYRASFNE